MTDLRRGVLVAVTQSDATVACEHVLTTRVDLLDLPAVGQLVAEWARGHRGRMICATNVHMVMEAFDDSRFSATVNSADLVVPDGRPIVWACRVLGHKDVAQVRGLDLAMRLCQVAERERLTIGLYGGSRATVQAVRARLLGRYPALAVTHAYSPPYRPSTAAEDAADTQAIRDAGVHVLFVGLGCPKQEQWMAAHRDQLPCVMVGVGAVFDMLAGERRVAPLWLQRAGLEWVFRLLQEPRRLCGRYAKHNARFIAAFGARYAAEAWRRRRAKRAGGSRQ